MGQPKSGVFRTIEEGAPRALLLVADGDAEYRAALTRSLRLRGYATRHAIGAADAFAICASWQPALMICSSELPLLDGAVVAEMVQTALGDEAPAVYVVGGDDVSLALEDLDIADTYDEAVGE